MTLPSDVRFGVSFSTEATVRTRFRGTQLRLSQLTGSVLVQTFLRFHDRILDVGFLDKTAALSGTFLGDENIHEQTEKTKKTSSGSPRTTSQ